MSDILFYYGLFVPVLSLLNEECEPMDEATIKIKKSTYQLNGNTIPSCYIGSKIQSLEKRKISCKM